MVRGVQRDVEDAVPCGVVQLSGVVRKPREGQAPPLRGAGLPGCGANNGTSRTPSPTGWCKYRAWYINRGRGKPLATVPGAKSGAKRRKPVDFPPVFCAVADRPRDAAPLS